MRYEDFLKSKMLTAPPSGFQPHEINKKLFDWQQDIVAWGIKRGKAAYFEDCGLGKTPQQLETARQIQIETNGKVLILAPLAVAAQTVREGEKFDIEVIHVKEQSECDRKAVYITNYDKLQRFDASKFSGIVLDESSILKSYTGKTRNQIISGFKNTPYRLACTATPSPNDYEELGNHAEFLGVMTRTEMLATFFVHDAGKTQDWRLKKHATKDFWKWVCSWAVCVRKPSDIGYSDDGFTLPELKIHEQIIECERSGWLVNEYATTLSERRQARRESLELRVKRAAELIAAEPNEPWIVWCDLNPEGDALQKMLAGSIQVKGAQKPEEKEKLLIQFSNGEKKRLVSKPSICGFGLNWQHCARVIFCGLSDSYEQFYQAVRRCYRFGQTKEVHAHLILSEAEYPVLQNIQRKHKAHEAMSAGMLEAMRDQQRENVRGLRRETDLYNPQNEMIIPTWMRAAA